MKLPRWLASKLKIKVYGLVEAENKSKFLTFSFNRKDLDEYCKELIKIKHVDHFILWCKNKQLDPNSKDAFDIYFEDCIPLTEKQSYLSTSIDYKFTDLMAVLRMFSKCIPLGCSFESPIETQYANALSVALDVATKYKQAYDNNHSEDTSDGE